MKRQTFNEINITPLTDIFLVLLIIMMVIAPILDQQGLSLAIPEYVEENNVNTDVKIIEVQVTEDNKFIIDETEVAEAELFDFIKNLISTKPDGLMIQANANSNHGSVVKLMDSARNAGVKSISIVEM